MKKILFTLIALTTAVFAQDTIKVTGDRVSLRAEPDTNAVLLGKAMMGDALVLKDNTNPDWVGVQPPESINLWVSGEFVSNNVVLPEILNIRSGPSLSHSLVGSAVKGDTLAGRGEAGGWLKIAPTSNTVIWISRTYVDAPAMPVVVVAPVEEAIAVSDAPPVVPVIAEPTAQEVMRAVSTSAQKKLIADPAKEQGIEASYTGVLQPADDMLYKLIDDHFSDIIVCYVRGNAAQMKTFSGMKLEVTGKAYWAEGKDLPVVVPSKIKLFAGK